MSRNDQQPIYTNAACRNQRLTNIAFGSVFNEGKAEKYNIWGGIKILLGRDCEIKKVMSILKDIDTLKNTKLIHSRQVQYDLSSVL